MKWGLPTERIMWQGGPSHEREGIVEPYELLPGHPKSVEEIANYIDADIVED